MLKHSVKVLALVTLNCKFVVYLIQPQTTGGPSYGAGRPV